MYRKRGTLIVASSITEAFELALTEERATKTPRSMYMTKPTKPNLARMYVQYIQSGVYRYHVLLVIGVFEVPVNKNIASINAFFISTSHRYRLHRVGHKAAGYASERSSANFCTSKYMYYLTNHQTNIKKTKYFIVF